MIRDTRVYIISRHFQLRSPRLSKNNSIDPSSYEQLVPRMVMCLLGCIVRLPNTTSWYTNRDLEGFLAGQTCHLEPPGIRKICVTTHIYLMLSPLPYLHTNLNNYLTDTVRLSRHPYIVQEYGCRTLFQWIFHTRTWLVWYVTLLSSIISNNFIISSLTTTHVCRTVRSSNISYMNSI